jgi:hypothetical protein
MSIVHFDLSSGNTFFCRYSTINYNDSVKKYSKYVNSSISINLIQQKSDLYIQKDL